MKLILSTLAAVTLSAALLAQPAEARCWWNGYGWQCWHPYHRVWRPYYHPYYHPYWHHRYWHHRYWRR